MFVVVPVQTRESQHRGNEEDQGNGDNLPVTRHGGNKFSAGDKQRLPLETEKGRKLRPDLLRHVRHTQERD